MRNAMQELTEIQDRDPGESRSAVPPTRRLRAWTPAQIAALAFGLWWVANGVAVFTAAPSDATLQTHYTVHALGLSIAVNGWHGVFHLSTGLAGIAVCWSRSGARAYALLAGVLYMAAALSDLLIGPTVFGLIHVDDLGSAVHAAEAAVLLAAWHMSVHANERAIARPEP